MTKKFTKIEMFQELSVILARIENKVDKLLELENRVKVLEAYVDTQLKQKYYGKIPDGYALSSGSLSDGGLGQVWMNTDYQQSGDLDIK
jgi:hypothetical protein